MKITLDSDMNINELYMINCVFDVNLRSLSKEWYYLTTEEGYKKWGR